MPTFECPTQYQAIGTDRLWSRVGAPVGQTVVKVDGQWTLRPYPAQAELQKTRHSYESADGAWTTDESGADLVEGQDFFFGGYVYVVSDELAAELTTAGFEVVDEGGFGIGPFGSGGYGE